MKRVVVLAMLMLAWTIPPAQAHIPTQKYICNSWVNYHYPAGYAIYVFPTHLTYSPIPPLVMPPQCIHKILNFKKFEVDQ